MGATVLCRERENACDCLAGEEMCEPFGLDVWGGAFP